MNKKSILINRMSNMGISLNDIQVQQFIGYYELLMEWNQVMNLTAITDYDEVVIKHFMDSLSLADFCDIINMKSCIDVGTGAGFPGIPLKILFPDKKFTLLDSLNKRVKFLKHIISELKLDNVTAIHGRAEDVARMAIHREQYDLCVSRAVAQLNVLSEYCIPFVKPDGYFISYKSEKGLEEAEQSKDAIIKLGGLLERTESFCLPDTDMNRVFVLIKKVKRTNERYPRKSGLPSKEPLR